MFRKKEKRIKKKMENEGKKKRAGKNINKYIIIISPT
jgi:hypothetical protein